MNHFNPPYGCLDDLQKFSESANIQRMIAAATADPTNSQTWAVLADAIDDEFAASAIAKRLRSELTLVDHCAKFQVPDHVLVLQLHDSEQGAKAIKAIIGDMHRQMFGPRDESGLSRPHFQDPLQGLNTLDLEWPLNSTGHLLDYVALEPLKTYQVLRLRKHTQTSTAVFSIAGFRYRFLSNHSAVEALDRQRSNLVIIRIRKPETANDIRFDNAIIIDEGGQAGWMAMSDIPDRASVREQHGMAPRHLRAYFYFFAYLLSYTQSNPPQSNSNGVMTTATFQPIPIPQWYQEFRTQGAATNNYQMAREADETNLDFPVYEAPLSQNHIWNYHYSLEKPAAREGEAVISPTGLTRWSSIHEEIGAYAQMPRVKARHMGLPTLIRASWLDLTKFAHLFRNFDRDFLRICVDVGGVGNRSNDQDCPHNDIYTLAIIRNPKMLYSFTAETSYGFHPSRIQYPASDPLVTLYRVRMQHLIGALAYYYGKYANFKLIFGNYATTQIERVEVNPNNDNEFHIKSVRALVWAPLDRGQFRANEDNLWEQRQIDLRDMWQRRQQRHVGVDIHTFTDLNSFNPLMDTNIVGDLVQNSPLEALWLFQPEKHKPDSDGRIGVRQVAANFGYAQLNFDDRWDSFEYNTHRCKFIDLTETRHPRRLSINLQHTYQPPI